MVLPDSLEKSEDDLDPVNIHCIGRAVSAGLPRARLCLLLICAPSPHLPKALVSSRHSVMLVIGTETGSGKTLTFP